MWTDAYLESRILSADPIELVQLLYEGAIEAVRAARRQLAAGDIAGRSAAISKAMAILAELSVSLDPAAGGEVSRRLAGLYDYMQRRLLDANVRQADEPLAETLSLLDTLLDGWKQIRQPVAAAETSGQIPSAAAGYPPLGSYAGLAAMPEEIACSPAHADWVL